jgi:threonine dehydrogenase-like Zn-dependent dehydrogenase
VDVDALVSHRFPLADLEAAFATAADKSGGAVKVVVTMPE